MNLKQVIKDDIYNILTDHLNRNDILVESPKDRKMADYAVPCFSLAKILRKSPNDIAQMIKDNLDNELYENVEVVNGYLNIFINKKSLLSILLIK